jgi:hypothetical protein
MRLFLIIFIGFINIVHADEKNIWGELSVGGSGGYLGTKVNFKLGDETSNWAIELVQFEKSTSFSHIENRDDGSYVNVNFKTLGGTKNWNRIGEWGYSELGVGLGIAEGTWAKNCTAVKESVSPYLSSWLLSPSYYDVCDISDGVRFGIPLHASAVFGKYLGMSNRQYFYHR